MATTPAGAESFADGESAAAGCGIPVKAEEKAMADEGQATNGRPESSAADNGIREVTFGARSRRALLAGGALGLVGLGADLLSRPGAAQAAPGDSIDMGFENDAGSSYTILTSTGGAGPTFEIDNTGSSSSFGALVANSAGNGPAVYADGGSQADALEAHAHSGGRSALFATNDGGGYGVYASANGGNAAVYASSTGTGAAVYADGGSQADALEAHAHISNKSALFATNDVGGYGVYTTANGAKPAIYASNSGGGPAVQASSLGSGATIQASSTGSGPALLADGGTKADALQAQAHDIGQSALNATNDGGGWGVYVTSTGIGAIYAANTVGSGSALEATDAGTGDAVALDAHLDNPSNSFPAVVAITRGTGATIVARVSNKGNTSPAVKGEILAGTGPALYGDGGSGSDAVEAHAHTSNRSGAYLTNDGGGWGVHASASGVNAGVLGLNTGAGAGVEGSDSGSGTGSGVIGDVANPNNSSAAVFGLTAGQGSAVLGEITNTSSIAAAVAGTSSGGGPGVAGTSTRSIGVLGQGTTGATGVSGTSDSGIGGSFASKSGRALKVIGKASFSRSGIVAIPAGSSSQSVTLTGVTTASMILATIQQNAAGFTIQAAVPAKGSFTIFLNKPAPSGGLAVAWFVLD